MPRPPRTRERILDAALALFNEHGFANVPNARIAEEAGIAVGNLWYHFRTKDDLVRGLMERARGRMQQILDGRVPASVLGEYVHRLRAIMQLQFRFRFLLRDRLQLGDLDPVRAVDSVTDAHFARLRQVLARMQDEGLFRGEPPDPDVLATTLWIVTRHWWDYLHEREHLVRPTWTDHERGFRHHVALLSPYLTAAARRQLEAAAEATIDTAADLPRTA